MNIEIREDLDPFQFHFEATHGRIYFSTVALEPDIGMGVVWEGPAEAIRFVRTSFERVIGEAVEVEVGPGGGKCPFVVRAGGHFVVVWLNRARDQLSFQRLARDGGAVAARQDIPLGLTRLNGCEDFHVIAVDDRIYISWAEVVDDISRLYVARGPFGCGVHE